MISLDQKTAYDISKELSKRVRKHRKERKLTQEQLAKKSGVSLGSYKRFEQTGQIALTSLCNIAIALGCEDDFDELFNTTQYNSIQEMIDARRKMKEKS